MIAYLTKDKNGDWKLHDKISPRKNRKTRVWESFYSNISVDEENVPKSLINSGKDKPAEVLVHITPVAVNYQSKVITEVRPGNKVSYEEFNLGSFLCGVMIYGGYHDKYESTIHGVDWYNHKYLVQKHNDKKPKWYDWSQFKLL